MANCHLDTLAPDGAKIHQVEDKIAEKHIESYSMTQSIHVWLATVSFKLSIRHKASTTTNEFPELPRRTIGESLVNSYHNLQVDIYDHIRCSNYFSKGIKGAPW